MDDDNFVMCDIFNLKYLFILFIYVFVYLFWILREIEREGG